VILIWVIVACLLATAFFSAGEMAFIAANRLRIRHLAENGHRVAQRYLEAFGKPEEVLSAVKMGVPVMHIVAASVATWGLLPHLGASAALVVTLGLTPIMLVLGEVIPKAIAQHRATGLILRFFPPLAWSAWLLLPLTWIASKITRALVPLFGGTRQTRQLVSREELKLVLQTEPEETDVTTREAEMIDKIFSLGETKASQVMVPLPDVVMLDEDATPREAIELIRQRGFSRIPIFSGQVFNIVGIVTAMDLFRRGPEAPALKNVMRPARHVPETMRIDDLLREMQKARIQIAVVVDEYGTAVGILTMEDILEQIVGRIEDEHDRRTATVELLPDGSYLLAGRLSIDELNDELHWELPKADYETVGGLVLASLNRIPRPGEEVTVGRYHLTVVDADERRVLRVKAALKK
jgi:CBS domain containing-hemolysin-like protein